MGNALISRASNKSNVNVLQEVGTSQADVMSQNACTSSFSLLGHKHSANDITSGTLPISRGGTGASSAATARTNLEVRKGYTLYSNSSDTSGTITISGSFSDYAFIVISVDGNGISKSIVCLPQGSENMGVTYSSGSNNDLINRTALVYPSGSTLTWKRNYNVEIFNNNTVSFSDGVLKIIKIVGYKY